MHELPNNQEQFKKILENIPGYEKFIKVNQVEKKEGKKTIVEKYEIKEAASTDEDWKKMCYSRWSWVRESLSYEKDLTSKDVSERAINYSK